MNYDSVEVPRHLLEELVKCLGGTSKRAALPGNPAYYSQQVAAGDSSRGGYERPDGLLRETRPGGIPALENDLANLSRSQSTFVPKSDPRPAGYAEQAPAGYSSRGDYGPLESRTGADRPGRIPALEKELANLSRD